MADNNEISIHFSSVEEVSSRISKSGDDLENNVAEVGTLECDTTLDVTKELINIGNDLKEVTNLFSSILKNDGKMIEDIVNLKKEADREQGEAIQNASGS